MKYFACFVRFQNEVFTLYSIGKNAQDARKNLFEKYLPKDFDKSAEFLHAMSADALRDVADNLDENQAWAARLPQ